MAATPHAAVEAAYPLSPLQQGILFHGVLAEGGEGGYASQVVCELHGALDRGAFTTAWRQLAERHPVLRTAFAWEGLDEALQVVLANASVPISWHDLGGRAPAEREQAIEAWRAEERRRGFDFHRAPLMRLAIFDLGDDEHRLVWSFHHLIMDGWSEALLVEEFARLYRAAVDGGDAGLPPAVPFGSFIRWLERQDLSAAESYWRQVLSGFASATTPPGDVPSRDGGGAPRRVETDSRALSVAAGDALRALARSNRLTLSTLVQGAWSLLLVRESGSRDVVYGTAVAGRPPDLPGVERIVGPFVNTLPVRVPAPRNASLLAWLASLQQGGLEARRFEHSPLVEVQGWSDVPRGDPLFETLYVFQGGPAGGGPVPETRAGSLELRNLVTDGGATNFPLTLEVEPGERVNLMLNADRSRFSSRWTGRALAGLVALLEAFPQTPRATLEELEERAVEAERRHREERSRRLAEVGLSKLRRARRRSGEDG